LLIGPNGRPGPLDDGPEPATDSGGESGSVHRRRMARSVPPALVKIVAVALMVLPSQFPSGTRFR
jgi:hypothetical protein